MNQMLELPDPVYQGLLAAARSCGVTPADWIASQLPGPARTEASDEARRAARERLWSHVVSLGKPTGIDNEGIDADLVREYGDSHEPESSR